MIFELLERYPSLHACRGEILAAKEALIACYEAGNKVLLCGNGGSCADCDHIVGELMKGFLKKRPLSDTAKEEMKKACPSLSDEALSSLQGALPAISLPSYTALGSAFCNDVDPELVFAQSVLGLGKPFDVLIAMSTSGNSKNVVHAAEVARATGLTVIGMTGEGGGRLSALSDVCIRVPERETFKIQELHLPIYHLLCAEVEAHFFKE